MVRPRATRNLARRLQEEKRPWLEELASSHVKDIGLLEEGRANLVRELDAASREADPAILFGQ